MLSEYLIEWPQTQCHDSIPGPSKGPDCMGGWVVGTVWAQTTGLVSSLVTTLL